MALFRTKREKRRKQGEKERVRGILIILEVIFLDLIEELKRLFCWNLIRAIRYVFHRRRSRALFSTGTDFRFPFKTTDSFPQRHTKNRASLELVYSALPGRVLLNKLDLSSDLPLVLLWPCSIESEREREEWNKTRRSLKATKQEGKSQSLICSCSHAYLATARQRWSPVIMISDGGGRNQTRLSRSLSLLYLYFASPAPATGISVEATANGNSRVTRNWRVATQKGKTEIEQRRTSRWMERQKSDEHDCQCK